MQQTYYCPKCRAPVSYGSQFCQYCGNQLYWPTPPPMYQQSPHYQQQQTYHEYKAKESKRKRNIWLQIFILVCLVISFVSVIFLTSSGSTQSDKLQLISHRMIKNNDGWIRVTGTAKNITSRTLFARIDIKYYDASGTLIGTGIDAIALGAGETWNFEAFGPGGREKNDKVTRYEISGRDSFIRN